MLLSGMWHELIIGGACVIAGLVAIYATLESIKETFKAKKEKENAD